MGTLAGEGRQHEGDARPAVHCSTGRLTREQAGTVDAWRARLLQDRPPAGRAPAGEAARLAGATDHPRASTSDAVAAAVAALLRRPPDALALAGYAYRAMLAQWEDSHGSPRPAAPSCPPVSYYLPAVLADQADGLRAQARLAAVEKLRALRVEAGERFPGKTDRAAQQRSRHIEGRVDALGLYFTRQLPRGAVARMAIDRWAARPEDDVAAEAVDWCQDHHVQWHRARRDMTRLRR
jgi:hypothetical protein